MIKMSLLLSTAYLRSENQVSVEVELWREEGEAQKNRNGDRIIHAEENHVQCRSIRINTDQYRSIQINRDQLTLLLSMSFDSYGVNQNDDYDESNL